MKKVILIVIFILTLITLIGCETAVKEETQQQTSSQPETVAAEEPEGTLMANEEDIPDISFDECIKQIKQTNPEISYQDANDNCYAIEAVNKGDKSLCDKIVNRNIKSACLNKI